MRIRFAADADIETISHLAREIWWSTYRNILEDDQISFMLEDMYSVKSLKNQFESNINFLIAEDESKAVGFAAYSFLEETDICRIHKLYISLSVQGRGIGRQLLSFIESEAIKEGLHYVELNVNRNNPALNFYTKAGFKIEREEDIPYFKYILNDYVMRKALQ